MEHVKELSKISVVNAGKKFKSKLLTVTIKLQCFKTGTGEFEGEKIGEAVIDKDFSENVKLGTSTPFPDVMTAWAISIGKKMQTEIDTYNLEVLYLGNETLDDKIALITGGLTG